MVQKASTPWSTRTVAEGGTDSPVGDLVPIPDKITPVVNTGFISMAAGATVEFDLDMLVHDQVVIAILDSSGNNINIDFMARNPTTLSGPYTPFADVGVNGSFPWKVNRYNNSTVFNSILDDASEDLAATWQFWKVWQLRGTQIRMVLRSNEGSDAGTISTGYLRLV